MIINEDTVKGKWQEIKGEVQKTWGKLTHDEIEKTKGDFKVLSGLIQQKYGEEKDLFLTKFSEIMKKIQKSAPEALSSIKTTEKTSENSQSKGVY